MNCFNSTSELVLASAYCGGVCEGNEDKIGAFTSCFTLHAKALLQM